MANNIVFEIQVRQIREQYQKRYDISIPQIQKIIIQKNDNIWAKFQANDLYNKKYKLYINTNLLKMNKKFIKQILFHEFTHLRDSALFLNRDIEEYKNIMSSYSEFHASECEMIERLEEIEEKILH